MTKNLFTVGQALSYGWNTFKKNWQFLVLFFAIVFVIDLIPRYVFKYSNGNYPIGIIILLFLLLLVGLLVEIGTIIVSLKIKDGEIPSFSDLGKHYKLLYNFILGYFLYLVVVIVGLLLLIVPGIYWGIKYQYTTYLIVDKRMTPISAFKKSGQLTKGYKWELFALGIIFGLLSLIGSILVIGTVIVQPVIRLASAYVYRKLSPKA